MAVLTSFCGGRVFGEKYGPGDPGVVALPGWQRDHRDFSGVADGLGCALVALDLPGFGATPPPAEAWGSEDYAGFVGPVLEELAGPVVLLGHSFGGRVAVHLAAEMPARVSALVLTGAPLVRPSGGGRGPRTPPAYRAIRWLRRKNLLTEARLEAARSKYGSSDYRAATGMMRTILVRAVNETYEEQIACITCPVELLWGDDDTSAPLAGAQDLARSIAGANLVVVEGAGHLTPVSVPDELRAAIERARARAGSPS